MSKAQKFRAALQATGAVGLPPAEAIKIIGGAGNLYAFTQRGEAIKADDGVNWILNPNYVPRRKAGINTAPPAKHKRKKAGKKSRQTKPKRKVAPRPAARARPSLTTLLLGNLAAAAAHLANTVRAEVVNVEKNPALAAALDQHARAADLVEAAA
jgi:hypothetical protein